MRVGEASGAEHADDADGAAGPPVRREDERHLGHLGGGVLVADEHLDATGTDRRHARHQVGEVGPVLEGREDAA
jgi:hypothetical protein